MGSPVAGKLDNAVSDRKAHFHYTEKTAIGLPVDIWRPGESKDGADYERHIKITDATGRPVARIRMNWDWGKHDWAAEWEPRADLNGTFTATIECDSGPFIRKPATATFTVK